MANNMKSDSNLENNVVLNTGNSASSGQPVKVNELIGTVETPEDSSGNSVVNVQSGARYNHSVRNVTTYNDSDGGELTWGAIAQGDYIYYDNSAALNALGVYLSTSPKNSAGADNKLFGKAITASRIATANTATIEVMQIQV